MKDQQPAQDGIRINTVLSEQGIPVVQMNILGAAILLTADACVQLGLNLLSAAYAARGEQALHTYATKHDLDVDELLRLVRE